MTVEVQRATPADALEWVAAWEACPYATFFHSPAWYATWQGYTGGALVPATARLELGEAPPVVVPLAVRSGRLGVWRHYESSPGWTYGGWLAPRELTADQAGAVAAWMARRCPELVWRWNPFAGEPAELGGLAAREDFTHVLDLDGGRAALEQSWSAPRASMGRKIRKARDSGVEVRVAGDVADWDHYDACYRETIDRWGARATTVYARSFFDDLRAHGGDRVRLWIAEHNDRVLAGAICLEASRHVVYWHGAARHEAFPLRALNLLLAEAALDACDRGKRWFDFNPSGGLAGVEHFKESFGARRLASPVVERRTPGSPVRRVLSAIRAWR